MRSILLLPLLFLAGCAASRGEGPGFARAADLAPAAADPWEGTNRRIDGFNQGFDRIVARPVAQAYRAAVPTAGRRGIGNAYNNLGEPNSFINALLQGKIKSAFRALDRILINTTLGVGGLADHATGMGLPEQPHDFGQTLTVWGVGQGPYFIFPFLGPGTLSSHVGFFVDFATDPTRYGERRLLSPTEQYGELALEVTVIRSNLIDSGAESLLAGAADPYATVRSAWLQRRRAELYDGAPPDDDEDVEPLPEAPAEATAVDAPADEAPVASPTAAPAPRR